MSEPEYTENVEWVHWCKGIPIPVHVYTKRCSDCGMEQSETLDKYGIPIGFFKFNADDIDKAREKATTRDTNDVGGELSHFNEQPFIWADHIKEWEDTWRKANPGYPIRRGRTELINTAVNIEKFFKDFDEPTEQEYKERFGEQKQEQHTIKRHDKYNIIVDGSKIRATEEQEARIRSLNNEQLNRFRKIMGGN